MFIDFNHGFQITSESPASHSVSLFKSVNGAVILAFSSSLVLLRVLNVFLSPALYTE